MNHAILRLDEERRILGDVYRQLLQDRELEGMDRATSARLLAEIRAELKDVADALRVLRNRLPITRTPPRVATQEHAHA